MAKDTSGVFPFALRVIAWGVALFALWFLAARPVSLAVAWGASALLHAMAPIERAPPRWNEGKVSFDVELDGAITYRKAIPPGAVFEVPVNPLRQTFGLPFFLALLAASRPARIGRRAALGTAILLALASLGLACEVSVNLGHVVGPDGAALIGSSALAASLTALGLQLGTLIFPTVVPLMLWAAMDDRYFRAT